MLFPFVHLTMQQLWVSPPDGFTLMSCCKSIHLINLKYSNAIKRGHSLTQSYNDFLHKTKLAFPNLLIDAEHIAGIDNTIPDKLSRGMSLGELGLTQRNQN